MLAVSTFVTVSMLEDMMGTPFHECGEYLKKYSVVMSTLLREWTKDFCGTIKMSPKLSLLWVSRRISPRCGPVTFYVGSVEKFAAYPVEIRVVLDLICL